MTAAPPDDQHTFVRRVLLLNPPSYDGTIYMKELGRCGRRSVSGEIWPQTGLAYLAAVVRSTGGTPAIIDAQALQSSVTETLRQVESFDPQLVIVGTTTPTYPNDLRFLESLKQNLPTTLTAMVGTHPTACVTEVLASPAVDLVLLGEAEETLAEMLNTSVHDWHSITGLAGSRTTTEPHPFNNGLRPYLQDLDQLPFPARDLLPNQRYRMPFLRGKPFATIIPSRGCPWRCIFCRAGTVWGHQLRLRSPANIVQEVRELVSQHNINAFAFMTDSLTLDRQWLLSVCRQIKQQNLSLVWVANSRVDAVDGEVLSIMAEAGCRLIAYGIESGNQALLDKSKKGITLDQCQRAINLTRQAGMVSMGYFMLGLPGETPETIEQTIRFAIALNPDYANFHIATPFPGTEFFDLAQQQGWLTSTDWSLYEEGSAAVLNLPALSPKDLLQYRAQAMRRFYFRPARVVKELCSSFHPLELYRKVQAMRHLFFQ